MITINSEKRKIQLTGGSTYIVSLPIKWVRESGLSAGDAVVLSANGDCTLTLSVESQDGSHGYRSQVDMPLTGDASHDFRMLVSNYLAGYDLINISSTRGFTAMERKFIKESVRRRLIGIEIVEESRNKMVLQSLLNYREISLEKSINSMFRIISSMHDDVLTSLIDNDVELALDVMQRDDDVDRFYLLTVRQLTAAIEDASLAQKIGMNNSKDCLGYRLVTKSMERVGDHVQRVAEIAGKMDLAMDENDEFLRVGRLSQDIFSDSLKALSELDTDFANDLIERASKISVMASHVHKINDGDASMVEKKRIILDSFRRISEYSADIAEIVINKHDKKMKYSAL